MASYQITVQTGTSTEAMQGSFASSETWANIRAITGTASQSVATHTSPSGWMRWVTYGIGVGNWYRLVRRFMHFDTSSIGNGNTVTRARLKILVGTNSYTAPADSLVVAEHTGSDSVSATASWSAVGSTNLGEIPLDDSVIITADDFNQKWVEIELETSIVNITGTTRLVAMLGSDFSNTEPNGSASILFGFNGISTAGVTGAPRLIVDYTVAPATVTGTVIDAPFTVISPSLTYIGTGAPATFSVISPTVTYAPPNTLSGTPGPSASAFSVVSGSAVSYVPDTQPPLTIFPRKLLAAQSDSGKPLQVALRGKGAKAVDLSNEPDITVYVFDSDGAQVTSYPASIAEAANGVIQFSFVGNAFSTGGAYTIEVEVDWGGGIMSRFPAEGVNYLLVTDDI